MISRYKFNQIEKSEFSSLCENIIFHNEKTDKLYGTIVSGERKFCFSWRSDLIDPKIFEINSSIVAVGIDQNFALIDVKQNEILLNLNLDYNFYDIKLYGDSIFVATELIIIEINSITFKVLNEYDLPEIYEDISINESMINVQCLYDVQVEIKRESL